MLISFEKWKELSPNFKTLKSKLGKRKAADEETGSFSPTSFYKFLSESGKAAAFLAKTSVSLLLYTVGWRGEV